MAKKKSSGPKRSSSTPKKGKAKKANIEEWRFQKPSFTVWADEDGKLYEADCKTPHRVKSLSLYRMRDGSGGREGFKIERIQKAPNGMTQLEIHPIEKHEPDGGITLG